MGDGVGGTTLKINSAGRRFGELGWSTARSFLFNATYHALGGCTEAQLGTWTPIDLALAVARRRGRAGGWCGGHPLGFLNPSLYALYGHNGALYDILPAGKQDQSRADFANSLDDGQGFLYSTRIIDYEGQEQFCNAGGGCKTRELSLHIAPGFDNMTGLGSPGEQFLSRLAGP